VWTIAFIREGDDHDTLGLTLHSAVFSGVALEATYTAKDLMRLRELGGGSIARMSDLTGQGDVVRAALGRQLRDRRAATLAPDAIGRTTRSLRQTAP
jgi:hypothetical protein